MTSHDHNKSALSPLRDALRKGDHDQASLLFFGVFLLNFGVCFGNLGMCLRNLGVFLRRRKMLKGIIVASG